MLTARASSPASQKVRPREPGGRIQWAIWGGSALLAVPLGIRCGLGFLARYTVDDFCWPGRVSTMGLLGLQSYSYTHYFGRYSSTFLISLAAIFGPGLTTVLPFLAILSWIGALALLMWEITGLTGVYFRLGASILVAELIVATVLSSAKDSLQPIYWQTGMLTYLPPLVLFPLAAALLLRGTRSQLPVSWLVVVAFAAALVIGGFSEVSAVEQVLALLLALGLSFIHSQKPSRLTVVLVAGLIGSVLSLAVVGLSPGNSIRHSSYQTLPLPTVGFDAMAYSGWMLARVVATPYVPLAILAIVVLVIGLHPTGRLVGRASSVVLMALGSLVACNVVGFQGLAAAPPDRAQFLPLAVVVVSALYLGWVAGARVPWASGKESAVSATLVIFLAGFTVFATGQSLSLIPRFEAYAVAWDSQDALINRAVAQGERRVTIQIAHNPYGLEDVGMAGSRWATPCAVQFYGVGLTAASVAR